MRPATEGQAARQRLRGGAPPVEVIGYDGRDDRRRLFPLVAYARRLRRTRGMLTRRALAANAVSPHQFSPFGNPHSGSPLSNKEHTKGGTPQGAPARRLYGADGGMEPLCLHAFNVPHPQGGYRDCRLRTAALRVAANTPPLYPHCATAPKGWARWSGRKRLVTFSSSHASGPSRNGGCQAVLRLSRPRSESGSPESRLHNAPGI